MPFIHTLEIVYFISIIMVRHTIMWKFKPSDGRTPKEIAEDIKERYQAILGIVPGLKNVEVGVNRNESATSYDAVLIEDFDSWQDLAAYKADPIRDELTKYVDKFVDVRARDEYER